MRGKSTNNNNNFQLQLADLGMSLLRRQLSARNDYFIVGKGSVTVIAREDKGRPKQSVSLHGGIAECWHSPSCTGEHAGVRRRNDECRLTIEDVRSSLTNEIRFETKNKLAAGSLKLAARNTRKPKINPISFSCSERERIVTNLLKQAGAYETQLGRINLSAPFQRIKLTSGKLVLYGSVESFRG